MLVFLKHARYGIDNWPIRLEVYWSTRETNKKELTGLLDKGDKWIGVDWSSIEGRDRNGMNGGCH